MNECAFCGDDRVVHHHHIIPRRFGGSDAEENLLSVCPTCHAIVERTWNDEFYDALGAKQDDIDHEEQALLNATRVMNLLSKERLAKGGPLNDGPYDTRDKRIAMNARRECLRSVVDLLEGYWLCAGCQRPASTNPCANCGTRRPAGEVNSP